MDLNDALQTIGIFIAIGASLFALIKAAKMFPVEQASTDAGASKDYAETAKLAAEMVTGALKRIEQLERRSVSMEDEVEGLQSTLVERDKCIETLNDELRQRDALIEEWTNGIKILIGQLRNGNLTPLWEPRQVKFSLHR